MQAFGTVHLTLIRSATLRIETAGQTLLVDPQLDPAGARDAGPDTPNPRRSPLVDLPEPPEVAVAGIDAVLVTHLHRDHFDDTATRAVAPATARSSASRRTRSACTRTASSTSGPVHADAKLGDLLIARTDGRHGTGEIGEQMGAGLRLRPARRRASPASTSPATRSCATRSAAPIAEHRPAAIVVNASAARFNTGDPIVMDNDDVVALARETDAQIVAIHFETRLAQHRDARGPARAARHEVLTTRQRARGRERGAF